jgi:hypothetical protein
MVSSGGVAWSQTRRQVSRSLHDRDGAGAAKTGSISILRGTATYARSPAATAPTESGSAGRFPVPAKRKSLSYFECSNSLSAGMNAP